MIISGINDKSYSQSDTEILAEDLVEKPMPDSLRAKLKSRVFDKINAACPEGGESCFEKQSEWVSVTADIDVKVLTQDHEKKLQTAYWRLKPGTVVPSHYHNNDEDCLVIEGDIRFGEHSLNAGDFHMMKKGTTHPPMTTVSGALLYLKHDIHEDLSWLAA